MPQISQAEFERLPLRAHAFLRGVPLHDAWAIDLPRPKGDVTLDAFLRETGGSPPKRSPVVDTLMNVRLFLGRIAGLDREPRAAAAESFADRLTPEDRERSLVPAGKRYGPSGLFRVVYRFENEQLGELINKTAHAAALSALVETPTGYRYYFAVYVRSVGRLTPLYMALIDPFRKLLVYPALLRDVRASWQHKMIAGHAR